MDKQTNPSVDSIEVGSMVDKEANPSVDYEVVGWESEDDPKNPLNFSPVKKWTIVVIVAIATLCVTCCSSMVALSYDGVIEEWGISRIVATLSVTLFLAGLGIGPLFLGPFSEYFGRSPIYLISFFLFVVFNIPVAAARNVETWLIGRFFSGLCGSAFLSVAGGTVADLFPKEELALPMGIYTLGPFLGPVLGPLMSGFINQNLYWRWTWYILLIWAGAVYVSLVLFVPETYAPAILRRKAIKLRHVTKNPNLMSPLEIEAICVIGVIVKSFLVPIELLLWEPMALFLCIWTAVLLGILYMFFSAFPIVFGNHGFDLQQKGMSFIGIGIGIIIGILVNPLFKKEYMRVARKLGKTPPPEERLKRGMVGAILVPVSLFWFAFTTYTSIHWIVPMIASVPFGLGTFLVYQATFTFLVDAYKPYAASAMASNSFLRSAFAAAFPLFTTQMYARLGPDWASGLCAFLTLAMVPLPFVFYRIGAGLRKTSRFADHSTCVR